MRVGETGDRLEPLCVKNSRRGVFDEDEALALSLLWEVRVRFSDSLIVDVGFERCEICK